MPEVMLTCLSSKLLSNLRARLTQLVVVGEDTDLLILLLHHANMDSKELYFRPEPKQKYDCGILKHQKKIWDPVFLGCMASARHFLKSSAVMNSLKLVKCLCKKMPIRMISSALEKKHSTMVIQGMTWRLYATNDSGGEKFQIC